LVNYNGIVLLAFLSYQFQFEFCWRYWVNTVQFMKKTIWFQVSSMIIKTADLGKVYYILKK
jgi:hypothetical protein